MLAFAPVLALGAIAGLAARAPAAEDCVALEDFSKSPLNAFPAGWEARNDEARGVYSVKAEDGTRFLRASAKNVGSQAARPHEWNLAEYPVLAWKWRPRAFPEGANEQSGKNDSVLAVYAVFPYSRLGVKLVKSVKYVWSEKVPVGTHLESSQGRTQVRVLRSGVPADKDAWVEQRVNVAEDYQRFFKEKELARPGGIAVLTDSDDTQSYAEGDYADFRLCRG